MNKKQYIIIIILIGLGVFGKYIYQLPKYDDGEKAPQIEAALIDGSSFKLSEMKGRYVLLDFWGSWCGPCRKENPLLVGLWNKYHQKGFDIISIGVERSEEKWKSAIEQDGLVWKNHIGQFDRFKSPIVKDYGVKTIPTKYLVNPDGKIIGVNQSIDEIDKFLSKELK